MPYIPKGTLDPAGGDLVIGGTHTGKDGNTIIANSGVMVIGYLVEQSSVTTVARFTATATIPPLGVCVGICKADGTQATFDAGSTTTVTVAADNATVAKIYAQVSISENTIFSATSSATPGTTTGSNQRGFYIVAASSASAGQVTESTARTANTTAQWSIQGVDPEDTSRILVSLNKSFTTT